MEDFPDQERRRNQVAFPFHDADEEEIQEGDAELGEGGETEVFFSDLSEEYVTYNASYTS
jgi:N-acetylglutamate synthase/N-acetylornithine aminotransferase